MGAAGKADAAVYRGLHGPALPSSPPGPPASCRILSPAAEGGHGPSLPLRLLLSPLHSLALQVHVLSGHNQGFPGEGKSGSPRIYFILFDLFILCMCGVEEVGT